MLAKTNVPEYSSAYETDNCVHGRTNHPLDPARTPGGSSGGEAALAAADATPLGIGTDGGGSLRVPAHYCGVVGLRPTVGRVPDTGTWPQTRASGYMDLFCVGPIARFAQDIALVLPLISGPGLASTRTRCRRRSAIPAEVAVRGCASGCSPTIPRLGVTCGTLAALARAARALSDAGAARASRWPRPGTRIRRSCSSTAWPLTAALSSGPTSPARRRPPPPADVRACSMR